MWTIFSQQCYCRLKDTHFGVFLSTGSCIKLDSLWLQQKFLQCWEQQCPQSSKWWEKLLQNSVFLSLNLSSKAGQRLLTASYLWLWASASTYRLARHDCSYSATANTRLCKYCQDRHGLYNSDPAFEEIFYRCSHQESDQFAKKNQKHANFFIVVRVLKLVRLFAGPKSARASHLWARLQRFVCEPQSLLLMKADT